MNGVPLRRGEWVYFVWVPDRLGTAREDVLGMAGAAFCQQAQGLLGFLRDIWQIVGHEERGGKDRPHAHLHQYLGGSHAVANILWVQQS